MSAAPELPRVAYPDLAGARVLVTGTSQGIGRAIAAALLDQGATVAGIARRAVDLGDGYVHHACDLADAAALEDAVRVIAVGPIDAVVNVAGIDPKIPLDEADLAAWHRVIDLDLRAYHLVIHHAIAALRRGRLRSIVNLSSINHRLGVPKRELYTIAKCGIIGLTRGLCRDLGREGIRINTISPGWILTERQREEYFPDTPEGRTALEDLFSTKQSLRLQLQAEDIAAHALFYLSAVSRGSTGHNCVVDAGWTLE